jgi:glucokinase
MILAGDVGGTKTNLAVFDPAEADFKSPVVEASYASQQFTSLEEIIERFVAEHPYHLTRAGFGIAGAVIHGRVETPNLPWRITADDIRNRLGLEQVLLINDLVANAYGIASLAPEMLHTLNEGEPTEDGNLALISAGTGCGMTFLVNSAGHYTPIGSEGGHIDFAPRSAIEIGLLEYLRKHFGRVSYERVLSGPGLHNIYSFLKESRFADEPEWLAHDIATGDPGAAISRAAFSGRSELAMKALDIFANIYGAMAGNLALMVVATRGVYIGGGIAPKILKKLEDGAFIEAFRQKGRFTPMMEKIPVRVILDPKTALYGAARVASEA